MISHQLLHSWSLINIHLNARNFIFRQFQRVKSKGLLHPFKPTRLLVTTKFRCLLLRAHDCEYRDSQDRLKNLKILIFFQKNPFGKLSSKKIIFNFQESIVFEKIRKNENSSFYLINYAKIRVKMTYFIASPPRQD